MHVCASLQVELDHLSSTPWTTFSCAQQRAMACELAQQQEHARGPDLLRNHVCQTYVRLCRIFRCRALLREQAQLLPELTSSMAAPSKHAIALLGRILDCLLSPLAPEEMLPESLPVFSRELHVLSLKLAQKHIKQAADRGSCVSKGGSAHLAAATAAPTAEPAAASAATPAPAPEPTPGDLERLVQKLRAEGLYPESGGSFARDL